MALATTTAVAVVGVEGRLVRVEAHLGPGLPGCALVGLPDTAVSEARDRMRAAVLSTGEAWPARRLTIGLSPASLPKRGSAFDLAMVVAVLGAAGAVPSGALERRAFVGELGLDGSVRAVRGTLPAALAVASEDLDALVVPAGNAREATLVPGLPIIAVRSLGDLLAILRGAVPPPRAPVRPPAPAAPPCPDLADVAGQPSARRAVEVAAAGAHHLFLTGPPGTGKSMLANRLPGLLPPLTEAEALEVTAVHSVAGVLPPSAPLHAWPPFVDPHHTASVASLVGGGSGLLRPGAVSLAHRGVLFLDEAPQFASGALDALRQPLETGEVVLARSGITARFPARFLLVLAANPCPCAPVEGTDAACRCAPIVRRRYSARLSGPLLDRVDVRIGLAPVSRSELLNDQRLVESSEVVAQRVAAARARAARRLAGTPWRTNAEVPGAELRRRWALPAATLRRLDDVLRKGHLSARGVVRVLRLAWTFADLAGHARPTEADVSEAVGLRLGIAA